MEPTPQPASFRRRYPPLEGNAYRIDLGQLHLLTPALTTEEMTRNFARYCSLELRLRLVRHAELDRLAELFYGERFTEVRLTA
jgi:hypothetical protein